MVKTDLPDLFPFHGNWEKYVEELYEIYMREIVSGDLKFKGLPVRCRYHPETKGKGYGFWHVIQEGRIEEERLPDFRRCERIRWISWLIRNAEKDSRISWWQNKRGSDKRVVIWIEDKDFVVILAKRSGYYLLITAYTVSPRRKKAFKKERDRYWKSQKG